MSRLIILGAGGYGQSVGDVASQLGKYIQIFYLDDNPACNLVCGKLEDFELFKDDETEFYPAIGDNALRGKWISRLAEAGCAIATIIHPDAYVSPKGKIGSGVLVMPKACIGTNVVISAGCIVNLGAIIDHGCVIGECVHIAPGAVVKAENRIPKGMKIDSDTVVQNREYSLNG